MAQEEIRQEEESLDPQDWVGMRDLARATLMAADPGKSKRTFQATSAT
jgi:hypothetical protein